MTQEEFKAEILKAQPKAQFFTSNDGKHIICTPTEMEVACGDDDFEIDTVIAFHVEAEGHALLYAFLCTSANEHNRMRAPPAKKTRLMTPQECAGKWLAFGENRDLVCYFDRLHVMAARGVEMSARDLHRTGWKIADTPTSEPYSLEVEE